MPDPDLRDLQQQLHDLQTQMEANERLHEARYRADQLAITTAQIASDKRLDLLNESKATIESITNNLANRMMPREELDARFTGITNERQASREALWSRIEGRIDPLAEKIERMGRPNVGMIVSAGVLAVSLFSGLWFVLGLQINDRSNPLALQIETLKVGAASRDANILMITGTRNTEILAINSAIGKLTGDVQQTQSTLDSVQATQVNRNERITSLENEVSSGRAARARSEATTEQKLIEIESQLGNIENVTNIITDDTQQMLGVLWSTIFPKVTLPAKSYRPKLHHDPSGP